jgi:hypothetical protein
MEDADSGILSSILYIKEHVTGIEEMRKMHVGYL